MRKLLILLLPFCSFLGCKEQKHTRNLSHKESEKLVHSAIQLRRSAESKMTEPEIKQLNIDEIKLLNQAIAADSSNLTAYEIKITCESELMQWDSLISTGKRLLHIAPHAAPAILKIGQALELKGDSVSAKNYYERALALIIKKEASISSNNRQYEFVMIDKAKTLILLRRDPEGRTIFKNLYESPSLDERARSLYRRYFTLPRNKFLSMFTP